MRRSTLALLLLLSILPASSGCATCFDLICEMLFPGSTPTFEEQAEMDRQNANFAQREEAVKEDQERSLRAWKPHKR